MVSDIRDSEIQDRKEEELLLLLLRPREGWSMAKDATLSRRVVMTTRSWERRRRR
jgi:hypothetical protein